MNHPKNNEEARNSVTMKGAFLAQITKTKRANLPITLKFLPKYKLF